MVGGGVCKVIFMSNPTVVLRLGWGFDNFNCGKTCLSCFDVVVVLCWLLKYMFKMEPGFRPNNKFLKFV